MIMGCDIHFVVERKIEDHWVGVYSTDYSPYLASDDDADRMVRRFDDGSTEYIDPAPGCKSRNYKFFARIANVRGEGGIDPIGVPDDMSALASIAVRDWGEDGHSYSHMPLKDFVTHWAVAHWPDTVAGALITDRDRLDRLVREIAGNWVLDEEAAPLYRVVFWFDN